MILQIIHDAMGIKGVAPRNLSSIVPSRPPAWVLQVSSLLSPASDNCVSANISVAPYVILSSISKVSPFPDQSHSPVRLPAEELTDLAINNL